MDDTIILKQKASDGEPLEALFLPKSGLNLISFKKGSREMIHSSVREAAEKGIAGVGGLIGPHFKERKAPTIPTVKDPQAFPHIPFLQSQGIKDPFYQGIGRYAPWNTQATETKLTASLSGKDLWHEVPLSALEGQNFKMTFEAELKPEGLFLHLSVVSDTDSLVGIDYRYALPDGKEKVMSEVRREFINHNVREEIPRDWLDVEAQLLLDLQNSVNAAFHPSPNPLSGQIRLETSAYTLQTDYQCICQENSWILSHQPKAPYIALCPVSSQNPWRPNLTTSSLSIQLCIK